ncbi:MAG TPA: hypothetical protein VGR95_19000 [Thermoanaerobaculia bacterium]|nr:hypothetical protein [Thermoanaerobaculia bacterium]
MQPERRKHIRILTLKNFWRAALVCVLALAAANVISEFRAPHHGEYGRLTIRATPRPVVSDHVTIVGGPDGIHVETTQRNAAPKLSGGIFRQ